MQELKRTERNSLIITTEELNPFGNTETLADSAKALLAQQKQTWKFLRTNYESLYSVEVKSFDFPNFEIKVQFNPGRIKSSTAKVDTASIKARKCFLCVENLPKEQRGILYSDKYLILANPYPIFKNHFTIPSLIHEPQFIEPHLDDFLNLSKQLGKYFTVFYNGPKAGASAPDHFHFQAGEKDFIPLYKDISELKTENFRKIIDGKNFAVYKTQNYLRNILLIESAEEKIAKEIISKTISTLREFSEDDEPMLNILAFYEADEWKVAVIPRQKHRPDYYFREDDSQILFSPAAVDLGGVCITPRKEDFHKMTKDILIDSFKQVTFPDEKFEKVIEILTGL